MLAGDLDEGFVEDDDAAPLAEACELPAAKIRREAFGEGDPDEDGWVCPICPLTDHASRPERLPPCIAGFREALATQPRLLPEPEACRLLSALFNRTCFARDVELPATARAGVVHMCPGDVQAHLAHIRHLPDHEDHMLDDRIWYALRLTEQIERSGLWFENVDRRAKLDRAGFSDWCKAQEALKKLVEIRHRFHGQGPRLEGGVQKRRGRPQYHYSRPG